MKRTTILIATLAVALCPLAHLSTGPLRAAEGQKGEQWDSLDPRGLVKLAQQLTAGKTANEKEAARLAAYIDETYLSNGEAVRSVQAGEWANLCRALGTILSPEERAEWTQALKAAYVADGETFAGLDLAAVGRLSVALEHLGDAGCRQVAPAWMAGTSAWRELAPGDLVALADRLNWCGEAGASARADLVRHVEETYLATPAATRSVTPGQWRRLTSRLQKTLSAEGRGRWVTGLRSAYATDAKTLRSLQPGEFQSLVGALRALGDAKTPLLVARWIRGK